MTATTERVWKDEAIEACEALIAYHAETGLSQDDHAIRAGFNCRTFRRWLKKDVEPQGEYLKSLRAYLTKKKRLSAPAKS